jgi:hypothetical protein
MNAAAHHSPFARNARSMANPLAGVPLYRPVATVLGWTDAEKAAWCIARDRGNLAAAEANYAAACADLGAANRSKVMRRIRQGNALRAINTRRAALRRARAALAASLAAATGLAAA